MAMEMSEVKIEELGQLTELRVLSIFLSEWSDKLAGGFLCKLAQLSHLIIFIPLFSS